MNNQNSILQPIPQPPIGINNSQELYNNYKLYMKQYRAENKESIKISTDKFMLKNKEKYLERNIEYNKKYYSSYYQLKKDEISIQKREYYQAKKQRIIDSGIIIPKKNKIPKIPKEPKTPKTPKPPKTPKQPTLNMTDDEIEEYELRKLKRREVYNMKKQLNQQK